MYDYNSLGGKAKLLADAFNSYKEKETMVQGELFEEAGETIEKLQKPVKFVDYQFERVNDVILFDKELSLESLRLREGVLLETKLTDVGQVYFKIIGPTYAI